MDLPVARVKSLELLEKVIHMGRHNLVRKLPWGYYKFEIFPACTGNGEPLTPNIVVDTRAHHDSSGHLMEFFPLVSGNLL